MGLLVVRLARGVFFADTVLLVCPFLYGYIMEWVNRGDESRMFGSFLPLPGGFEVCGEKKCSHSVTTRLELKRSAEAACPDQQGLNVSIASLLPALHLSLHMTFQSP